jgi:ribosomal protein S18
MRAVRTSKLPPNAAAIHYKVARRILRAYLAENKQSKSKLRRKTVLSPQHEKELSKSINRLAQTGYPINLKIKRICVFT